MKKPTSVKKMLNSLNHILSHNFPSPFKKCDSKSVRLQCFSFLHMPNDILNLIFLHFSSKGILLRLAKDIFWILINRRKINLKRGGSQNPLKIIFSFSSNVIFLLEKRAIIPLNTVNFIFVSSHHQRPMKKGISSISKLQPLNSRFLS